MTVGFSPTLLWARAGPVARLCRRDHQAQAGRFGRGCQATLSPLSVPEPRRCPPAHRGHRGTPSGLGYRAYPGGGQRGRLCEQGHSQSSSLSDLGQINTFTFKTPVKCMLSDSIKINIYSRQCSRGNQFYIWLYVLVSKKFHVRFSGISN